jgi:XTP/dITP diphosphohydrolase
VPDLIVATANAGKLAELSRLLAGTQWRLVTQRALGVTPVEETGATFRENALLKARHAAAVGGLATLADDSGLEVDALDGAPGVQSARYAGEGATDEDNVAKLLGALRRVPAAQRSARFRCVIVLVRDAHDPNPIVCEGVWEGTIADVPRGANGFGYDPVFLPRNGTATSAELTPQAKDGLSHRGQALRQLLPALSRLLRDADADAPPAAG